MSLTLVEGLDTCVSGILLSSPLPPSPPPPPNITGGYRVDLAHNVRRGGGGKNGEIYPCTCTKVKPGGGSRRQRDGNIYNYST